MDENVGRYKRKSRIHGVGESQKVRSMKGIIEVNLPRNKFVKEGTRKRKPKAQEVNSVALIIDCKIVSKITDVFFFFLMTC